jgi:hypothetical protein
MTHAVESYDNSRKSALHDWQGISSKQPISECAISKAAEWAWLYCGTDRTAGKSWIGIRAARASRLRLALRKRTESELGCAFFPTSSGGQSDPQSMRTIN